MTRPQLWRWVGVLTPVVAVLLIPAPSGITQQGWHLLAIFTGTIMGSILRPLPAGAVVLLGIAAAALSGVLSIGEALAGYAEPIVWLVLCAFFLSRGVIKTGLGRRIAFWFVRALGRRSLGLGYALASTDVLLASIVPSNAARAGGVLFPITRSLAEAYDSTPGPTARRLGSFLMVLVYQCDVIAGAMFLTGQASNVLIAKFAGEEAGISLSYPAWLLGAILPALLSLVLVPLLLYRMYPPDIKETPRATELAAEELERMGPMGRDERWTLGVFLLVGGLWTTSSAHHVHYTSVALVGVCLLLLGGVLTWDDLVGERAAWDVFIWYGGLVRLAEALGEMGLTQRFAEATAGLTTGWAWGAALAVLLLMYFFSHYGFASITAHATAMYLPFLAVALKAGAPPALAAWSLAYASNLSAALTHYGTTPGPIYFGVGYVSLREWWTCGLFVALLTITIWTTVGLAWWRLLGWW